MSSASSLLRSLAIYGLCLPLAVFLGYLLASPPDLESIVFVGVLLFVLMLPMFLKWHHPWLVASWNMSAAIFFLPGRPELWMGLTAISLGISIFQYALRRERNFIFVPALTWPLLMLAVVTLITAELTGGVGLRSFGGDVYGGKRYFYILVAIAGFFAITSRSIPRAHATFYVFAFFAGAATQAIGGLAGSIHPSLRFIFLIFPVENVTDLATQFVVDSRFWGRSSGLNTLGLGLFCALLCRFGLGDLLSFRRPVVSLVLIFFMFVGLLGGFRSLLIQFVLIGGLLFYLEGLHRSRMLPAMFLAAIFATALVSKFSLSLPLSIQRTLAFLPFNVDPAVKMDAEYSSEWRLRMWEDLMPEIPRHLLLGKGYAMSGRESEILGLTSRFGYEGSELSSDYHNGPLSVILPLGLPGVISFGWLLVAGGRVVYRNYKYGDPELRRINSFLLAFFFAKVGFFMVVFGGFYTDLPVFTGTLALSLSLNGGVAGRPLTETREEPIKLRLPAALRSQMGA